MIYPQHGLREQLRRRRQILMRQLYPTLSEPRVQLALPVQRIVDLDFSKVEAHAMAQALATPEAERDAYTQQVLGSPDVIEQATQELEAAEGPVDEAAITQRASLDASIEEQRKARERAKRDRYNAKRKELRAQGLKPTR